MSLKNAAVSLVLGLQFFSLVAIYLLTDQNPLVTGLSVVIMAISLLIAVTGGWREVGITAMFAALVSVIAASLIGGARFGTAGQYVLPIVWGTVLLLIFVWIQRNLVVVPKDRAILIASTYTGNVYAAAPPIARPIMPTMERKVAEIPLYTLITGVEVNNINTWGGFNVTKVEVGVVYKVGDPRLMRSSIANKGQTQRDVAAELNMPVDDARNNVIFWEKLLARTIKGVTDGVVREVIYETKDADGKPFGPVEAYRNRADLLGIVSEKLVTSLHGRGITVLGVEFEHFEVDPARFQRAGLANRLKQETEHERIKAEREATRIRLLREAQSETEADRVRRLVQALRESGMELSPEDLEDIVISAIRASSEFEGDYVRLLPEPVSNAKPLVDMKKNDGKK